MKIKDLNVLIGCDPEIFVKSKKTGEFVSAVGLVEGTKEAPQKVKKGSVQVDGLALEIGIEPASCKEEFINNIKTVVTELDKMLPKSLELCFTPVARFSNKIIKESPPEALELGCEPDYSAYNLKENPRPLLKDPNLRSAGGHVHVGWGKDFEPLFDHISACAALAVELDLFLGVPSLYWDTDQARRSLYGAPGSFRPKFYGMEYRALSNQWLLSEQLMGYVYDNTVKAFQSVIDKPRGCKTIALFGGAVNINAKQIIESNWTTIGQQAFELNGELFV